MAKKKSKPAASSAATKTRKPVPAKPAKKSPPKPHMHDENCEHDEDVDGEMEEEIELNDTERKAFELVLGSEKIRTSLEAEVDSVVMSAVRKICKAHGAALTAAQAQNVALALFGD